MDGVVKFWSKIRKENLEGIPTLNFGTKDGNRQVNSVEKGRDLQ